MKINTRIPVITLLIMGLVIVLMYAYRNDYKSVNAEESEKFIKWVDFNVSYEAFSKAYDWDVKTYNSGEKVIHVNWIEVLAYVAALNGGSFDSKSVTKIEEISKDISEGKINLQEKAAELKCYDYYLESYTAILGGFVGEYTNISYEGILKDGKREEKKYGLKVYSPIAKGFDYSDYDDFGVSRSYGYKREHLGHDMMGQIGTPVIAVESGYVEAIGWNQYGGWRIGIRSFDKKRYYYYAHLRQNFPYCKDLKEGSIVTAGDVIGYMGHTGYSTKENVNNIDSVHLHFGIQLIFNECQKDCNSEIWINPYNIVRFLYKNKSEARKNEDTKEWHRINDIIIPEVENAKKSADASKAS